MKKLKFAALSLSLALLLGACSEDKAKETEEETKTATAEETVEEMPTELDLPAEEDIVVVVNGEEIPGNIYNSVARQLETSMTKQGMKVSEPENAEKVKSQAITVIVGNKLIIQDAEEKGHKADEADLEKRFEELKGQFESEEMMNKSLERTGYTVDDMKSQLQDQLIYESYIAKEVEAEEVTEEQVQEAYDGFAEASEEAPAFEEAEPMIRQSLEEQNTQTAVYERIEELKETAEIEVKI